MISWIQRYFQRHFRIIFGVLLAVTIISFIFTIGSTPGIGRADRREMTRDYFGHNLASREEVQRMIEDAHLSSYLQYGSDIGADQVQNLAFQRAAALHFADEMHIPIPNTAANTKTSAETATKPHVKPRESTPVGKWRVRVRGLRASIPSSIRRLKAMAAERAPTMATTIQPIFPHAARAACGKIGWIVVAMVGARSAAMAFNRLIDEGIDARNPRTRTRHLPTGVLSRGFTWGFVAVSALVFVFAAGELNPLCFRLAPVALGIVFFYSFTKRFTSFSHLVLGFALGVAPAAAWIAIRGSLDPRILWLTAAVTFWTAGFDVIYACQDYEFDSVEGLFSLPRRLGIAGALRVARLFHVLMVACLLALVYGLGLGALSLAGVAAVTGLLIYEHSLVKATDLSRVDAAFFTMNGYVSMLFFVFWAADVLWKS